jgi:hypothetical protein
MNVTDLSNLHRRIETLSGAIHFSTDTPDQISYAFLAGVVRSLQDLALQAGVEAIPPMHEDSTQAARRGRNWPAAAVPVIAARRRR